MAALRSHRFLSDASAPVYACSIQQRTSHQSSDYCCGHGCRDGGSAVGGESDGFADGFADDVADFVDSADSVADADRISVGMG